MEYNPNNSFCRKCKLYKNVKNPCVMGRGDPNADLLFLGEALGKMEDIEGKPFVGKSGQFLQHYLNYINVSYYIGNAVNCRPTDEKGNNRTPKPTEIECCRAFTIDLIRTIKPKVIVAVGSIAMKQLIKNSLGVEVARGKVFYHPELETHIIPTYHPAYILRNPNEQKYKNEFTSDLTLARDILKKPASRKIFSTPTSYKDPLKIKKFLEEALTRSEISIDLETSDTDPRKGMITDISLCIDVGKGIHITWKDFLEFRELFSEILLSDKIVKIYHNAVFDIAFFRANGFGVKLPVFDTMLAYHTITMSFEGGQSAALYGLKIMTWLMTQEGGYEGILAPFGGIVGLQKMITHLQKVTNAPDIDEIQDVPEQHALFDEETIAEIEKIDIGLERRLLECATYITDMRAKKVEQFNLEPGEFYSAMDADVTYRIYKYLKYRIDKEYAYVYYTIIIPLCMCLIRIHENGVRVNKKYVEKLIEGNNEKAEKIKSDFFKEIGYELNLNSPPQLSELMYEKLKIKPDGKYVTKKGKKPSTGEDAIIHFSKQNPVLKKILEYRKINKETSTYLEGYRKILDENDRVYPQYLQIGTATGRLSCINPNLQNLPRDNRIRNIIIPNEGCKLIVADLSQVELRVLAMLANDSAMINAFESGHDFHTYTACVMFGISIERFNKEDKDHNEKRSSAKTINFGIVYQMRAETLANNLNISLEKANDFMNKFFRSYPNVAQWIKDIKQFARKNGYVENLYGRRRYLPNINSTDLFKKEGAERQAVNTPVQGTAGDISYFGIIRLQEYIDKNNLKTKIIGTVHDSILFDAPEDEIDTLSKIIPDLMTKNIPRVTIELKADVDILDKWIK